MTIRDYYKYASLATAAYVRAGILDPQDPQYQQLFAELARQQDRLPLSIGRYLFDPELTAYGSRDIWNIRYYYGSDNSSDPIAKADKTGFGATLFEQGGEKVLAIRGTEPKADKGVDLWLADLGEIGVLGMALSQTVSMVNHILRLTTAADAYVKQFHIETSLSPISERSVKLRGKRLSGGDSDTGPVWEPADIYIDLQTNKDSAGEDVLVEGLDKIQSGETIRVTGHSLGGHLAALAARLFPGLVNSEVFVYNSPGVDPGAANFVGNALGAFSVVDDQLNAVYSVEDVQVELSFANQLTDELVELFKETALFEIFANGALGLGNLAMAQSNFLALSIVNLESEDVRPGDDSSLISSVITGQQALENKRVRPVYLYKDVFAELPWFRGSCSKASRDGQADDSVLRQSV